MFKSIDGLRFENDVKLQFSPCPTAHLQSALLALVQGSASHGRQIALTLLMQSGETDSITLAFRQLKAKTITPCAREGRVR